MYEKFRKKITYFSGFCVVTLCLLLPSKCIFHAFLSRDEADIVLETYMEDNNHADTHHKDTNETPIKNEE